MISMQKTGGLAALFIAISYIFGFILFATVLNPGNSLDTEKTVAFLIANKSSYYFTILILYIVGGLSMILLVHALSMRLNKTKTQSLLKIADNFGVLWAAIILIAGMVYLTGLNYIDDLYTKNPAQASTVWLTLSIIFEGLGGGTEILGGLWTMLVSWIALTSRVVPKSLNILGLVVGLAGVISIIPEMDILTVVFGLGQIIWFTGVGVVLLKSTNVTQ